MIGTLVLAFALSTPEIDLPIPRGSLTETIPGFVKVKLTQEQAAAAQAQPEGKSAIVPNGEFVSRIGQSGWTIFRVPKTTNVAALNAQLKRQGTAACVEPLNRVYPMLDTPNDPDWDAIEEREEYILIFEEGAPYGPFPRLWHLNETYAKDAFAVWPNTWYTAATKPANGPTIAVVDTGADMAHPDFINAGGTGPDIAQGGQWIMARSKQFRLGEVDPLGTPEDLNGHGTHVAGLALAAGNNGGFDGHGVVGTGYNCNGMMLRIFDEQGVASDADAGAAIYYAADNGADIINLSVGTESYSQLFQDAVTYAFQKGCVVVAAGNEDGAGGGDLGPIYPAACVAALAVSANGPEQIPATGTYSGYGWYLDVAAPGGDALIDPNFTYFVIQFVFSTAMREEGTLHNHPTLYPPYHLNYAYLAGTSMACPIVAGSVGLYLGKNNYDSTDGWNNILAFQAVQSSADGIMGAPYGGREDYQGYGSLNIQAMLTGGTRPNVEVGGVKGMLYSGGTPVANAQVRAQKIGSSTIIQTTTHEDGSYRFDSLTPGVYTVTGLAFSQIKSKKVIVKLGCDSPGQDLWIQGMPFDTTPPTIVRVQVSNVTTTGLRVRHWAYDTETGLDTIHFRIGTTSGGNEVMADREIIPDGPFVQLSGLALAPGTTYYLRARYVNGNNAAVEQIVPFTVAGGTTTVPPTGMTIFRGSLAAGDLASLLASDDNRLQVRKGPVLSSTESPVTVFIDAISPTQTVGSMQVRLEAHASTSNLNQQFDLFDYTANAWVNVDTRPGPSSDTVITVSATTPNRFIQAGTRAMRARVRYKALGPLLTSTWQGRMDQIVWLQN